LVQIPPASRIDQAIDENVIQISPGERTVPIAIGDTVNTLVFLASCDGYVESPESPWPSHPLRIRFDYEGGAADSVIVDSIHPAGRLDIISPTGIFIYGNEVLVSAPAYFDNMMIDPYHSEAWHWYALYPDTTARLESMTFVGVQSGPVSEIYVSAVSYKKYLPPPPHWADHDVGDCILTVTDQGIIGYMDGTQTEGSGFIYPESGLNHLYIGSPWVGLAPNYVANRDFDLDPAREWVLSEPDGYLWENTSGWGATGTGTSDQDIHTAYTDGGATTPRDLHVRQVSWAYGAPSPADDFVIMNYYVENQSGMAMDSVHIGLYMDFDIDPGSTNDEGMVDLGQRLLYLYDSSGIHTGIVVGDSLASPVPVSNLTLIDNQAYVWPQSYILDVDKDAFLRGADPQHILHQSPVPNDYSLLASTGPFTLQPGVEVHVPFAIVGGTSLEHFYANAWVAQWVIEHGIADADDGGDQLITGVRLLASRPNPFSTKTNLVFDLPVAQDIRLAFYDITGRRVRLLCDGRQAAGRHLISWDGRDDVGRRLDNGVYFLRLKAGLVRQSQRVIYLK
jgi:hypothetical protein